MRQRTIGWLSRRTGCNIETIRYYERIGLLPLPPRSGSGYRLYGDTHLKRLTFIRRSRQLGFTLEAIGSLLKLVDGNDYTCGQVQRITLAHLDEVRKRMADLTALERVLNNMASQCEGGTVPECPVIEALFELFEED